MLGLCHGKRFDTVGKGGLGGQAARLLDAGEDHPEMCDGDDVAPRMGREDLCDKPIHAGGDGVPAFAVGRGDIAGGLPEGAGQVGIAGRGFGPVEAIPSAEIDLAQGRICGQRLASIG